MQLQDRHYADTVRWGEAIGGGEVPKAWHHRALTLLRMGSSPTVSHCVLSKTKEV